jgi:hypothetical protein
VPYGLENTLFILIILCNNLSFLEGYAVILKDNNSSSKSGFEKHSGTKLGKTMDRKKIDVKIIKVC